MWRRKQARTETAALEAHDAQVALATLIQRLSLKSDISVMDLVEQGTAAITNERQGVSDEVLGYTIVSDSALAFGTVLQDESDYVTLSKDDVVHWNVDFGRATVLAWNQLKYELDDLDDDQLDEVDEDDDTPISDVYVIRPIGETNASELLASVESWLRAAKPL
jgi:hypothetical protein